MIQAGVVVIRKRHALRVSIVASKTLIRSDDKHVSEAALM